MGFCRVSRCAFVGFWPLLEAGFLWVLFMAVVDSLIRSWLMTGLTGGMSYDPSVAGFFF